MNYKSHKLSPAVKANLLLLACREPLLTIPLGFYFPTEKGLPMYVKLFTQILDSSIAEDYHVRLVFEDMLLLATWHGIVDMTHEAIARRTNVPLDIVRNAIEILEQPDIKSRRPDYDGRRIIRLEEHRDWGWQIVNFEHYRQIRNEDDRKEYMRNYIAKYRAEGKDKSRRGKQVVNNGKLGKLRLAHTDTDTDTDTEERKKKYIKKKFTPPSIEDINNYIKEKKLYMVDANVFLEFYESNGWKVGKNEMKSWKAALSGWHSRALADHGKKLTTEERNRKIELTGEY